MPQLRPEQRSHTVAMVMPDLKIQPIRADDFIAVTIYYNPIDQRLSVNYANVALGDATDLILQGAMLLAGIKHINAREVVLSAPNKPQPIVVGAQNG